MKIGPNGLREGLQPHPIPIGYPSIAAIVDWLEGRDQVALIDRLGSITYGDLHGRIHAAALSLQSIGVQPGDMVAATCANCIELVVTFFAVQRIGAIWVGINRPLAAPEKAAQLADCGARLYLADDQSLDQIEQERGSLPALAVLKTMGRPDSEFNRLIESQLGSRLEAALPDPLAPALIGYTSGTTGLPKGVVHNQHSVMAYLNACFHSTEGGQWVPGRRRALPIPITNPNGMIYGPVAALAGGGSFVAIDRADAEGVAEWVDRHQIEVLNATPPTLRDLLFRPDLQRFSLASLKAVAIGGAPPSVDLHAAFRERFGYELIADYGQTESPSSMASTRVHEAAPQGSTGKAHPHLELAILDSEGRVQPPHLDGELCARAVREGPWAHVYTAMLGYWNKPEETRAAFRDGWLRTGDMGTIDAQGYLTLVGRKKEMILRGGANIYPAEIEHVLRMHPKLNDAVVVGLPDERLGEIVVAYIELQGEAAAPELSPELREYCLARLARYKVPERWFMVEEIPRNALNKPIRSLLASVPHVELQASDIAA